MKHFSKLLYYKFHFLTICIFVIYSSLVNAQDDENEELLPFDAVIQSEMGGKRMKFYGNTRLNFNQAYFSNWISGGLSALTLLYGLDYNFNYSDRNGFVWDTNFLLSIGATYVSGSNFFRKADDRIEINSVVGKQMNEYWNYSGFLNFKTQLFPGFTLFDQQSNQEKVSQFFSPAIIQGGLGFYYKKSQNFWLNLSPVTGRVIFVSKSFTGEIDSDEKYFGVNFNKGSKFFFGALISGYFKKEIMENITWENKFSIYVNYIEKIQNVDFDWNSNIRFKVNNKISGNFILHLLYDDDLIGKLQVRELVGLGINIDL